MRLSLLLAAAALASIVPGAVGQVTVIVLAAIAGQFLSVIAASAQDGDPAIRLPFWLSIAVLAVFFAGLFGLPFWAMIAKDGPISLFAIFYHAGALVFGGGHVVLPLLRDGLVPSGWIGNDQFLAGYALAQAVPGPLFTFAAFLGAAGAGTPRGWVGALIALIAIFLPSFLLLVGLLPFWHRLKRNHRVRAALMGINAGVVGLLLAAFYNPILSSSLLTPLDFALALLMFAALSLWRIPAWLLVLAAGAASIISAVS
jgi:chromate transporter